jgi:hypothetical protein
MRKFVLPFAFLSIAMLTACGGGSSPSTTGNNPPPVVAVSITPTTSQLGGGDTQQFQATVTGSSNPAVTWTVSPSSAGTVSSSGLFTATVPVASQTTATVTATSQADSSKSASATVTLMPVSITVSPASVTFGLPGTEQFTATLQWSDKNPNVDWSLSPATGDGTLDPDVAGLYSTPPAMPATRTTVTVTATSRLDNTKKTAATVTIGPPGLLKGQYAFFFQGNDHAGMMQEAGSFTCDGNSKVTGIEDIVQLDNGGEVSSVSFTGTYTAPDGNGRGTLTIQDVLGTRVFPFNTNSQLTRAYFNEDDTSGIRGVGLMELQDPTAFPIASTKGDYAFGLSGSDNVQGRVGAIGRFTLDGVSAVSNGAMDINDAGATTANTAFSTGSYTAPNSTTGRGTAVINGFNMAYYVVSATEFVLVTVDTPASGKPLAGGHAYKQSGGPFNAASFSLTAPQDAVFYLVGGDPTTGVNGSDVAVGFITADGKSNAVVTQMDENNDGTVSSTLTPKGTYTVDASGNGRGTIHLANGGASYRDLTFYFVTSNTAFVLDDNTNGFGSHVGMGYMEPQTIQKCGCSTLSANYVQGSVEPATTQAPVESGSFVSDANGQYLSAFADVWDPSASGYQLDAAYDVHYDLVASGRGTIDRSLISPIPHAERFVIYIIAPNRGVAFSIGGTPGSPDAGMTRTQPTLEVIEK